MRRTDWTKDWTRMKRSLFRVASVAILLASAGLQAQQNTQTVEGVLNIAWGDPHPNLGSGGETLYTLESLNGTSLPPQLAGQNHVRLQLNGQENAAAYYFGKRVVV